MNPSERRGARGDDVPLTKYCRIFRGSVVRVKIETSFRTGSDRDLRIAMVDRQIGVSKHLKIEARIGFRCT